jgi:hypothetical protein
MCVCVCGGGGGGGGGGAQVHGLTRLRHVTEALLVGMVARANCGMMLAQADRLKATELRRAAMQVRAAEDDHGRARERESERARERERECVYV